MTTWTVQPGEEDRLDRFISQRVEISRAIVQKQIEEGFVTVNNTVHTSSKLKVLEGTVITFVDPIEPPAFPIGESVAIDCIYEDADLLVVNKPSGMIVHPNNSEETGTLVHALIAKYPEITKAIYDPENPVSRLRPGIVHRLDKDTCGLMVVAKTEAALLNLAGQFHEHTVDKTYRTLLYGNMVDPRTVDAPIQRKGGQDKNRMRASHDSSQGRFAVSHFKPLEVFAPYAKWPEEMVTLTEVRIETGRTHQIRVHAKFIGHPVMGDTLYGNKPSIKLSEKIGATHQLLQSCALSFTHPTTGKRMSFALETTPWLEGIRSAE